MADGIERRQVLVEGGVVDEHRHVALVDRRAPRQVVEDDDAAAAAAQRAEPFAARMVDEAVDDAVGAGELVEALARLPVEDLDAGRAADAVDVADLADAADGEMIPVGGEGERA